MKLLILGNARHGKDTLAELFNEHFGLTFMSSSQASADFFLYDQLKDKYGYTSPEECFNDRVNHRDEWYLAICDYNKKLLFIEFHFYLILLSIELDILQDNYQG